MRIGFACIVMELNDKPAKERVFTNRSMVKKTFIQKGLPYASSLALQNCKDLVSILKWNNDNGYDFFRMSSNIFPWHSEYLLEELPDYEEILENLKIAGDFAKAKDIRLTFHPGPFNKLCSNDDKIVINTIRDLEHHSEIFNLMGMSESHYNKINIHVGGVYGDKSFATKNFCDNFKKLSESLKSRLTVENDDRASMYSTLDLYNMVYKKVQIPIVHDIHHHEFCTGDISQKEAMEMAISTWANIKPVVHYSESRRAEQGGKVKENAHSDYIYNKIETFDFDVDIMVEAKKKSSL